MSKINFFRIFALIAFVALAGFSCFWTAESLYIWQPSITIFGAWLIAVVFFIVASICFGKLMKSLDKNEDFYGKLFGRSGALLLSLLGLLIFWLLVSLPTNTHTLLYRASIKNVLTADLNRTQGYLQGLKDNNVAIKEIDQKYKSKSEAVDALIIRLIAEIDHPGYEGIGHRFEKILVELDRTLSVGVNNPVKINRVENVGKSKTQWLAAINYYQQQAYDQLKLYRASCDKEINEIKNTMGSKELNNLIKNNTRALSDINKMTTVNNNVVQAAIDDLVNSYAYIKANAQYINFKENDKGRYTREGAMPEAKEMLSVPDVWKDYLTTDKYNGHGFVWWILIAILVDLAGFIFCYISFK
ncbi:MAG: hypothetical protein HDT07_05730 [Bacteroidales bacterium]|nr:hypothetical protein [Bacteroidales bacterium]